MEKRKQVEEAPKRAEQEKESILNSLVEHVIHEDTTMKILWANQAACESAGLSLEELMGRRCYEIWPKRGTPCPDCPVIRAMETGQPQKVEKTTPDGRSWFIRGYPVRDVNGDVTGAVEVTLEITEREKAERALKESERKLRGVIDTSSDAIVWVDTTGKITLVNKKGFEVTGFSEKDLVGKAFMDVEALTQESKEKILESFMKRLEGIDTPPYEVEIVTKNGETVPFELGASLIHEGDRIVGVQAIFRDLGERKKAEEALRESEAKFRNLAEQSPNMIFINKKGRVVYANKKCEEIMGYKRKVFCSPDFDFFTLIAPKSVELVKTSFSKHMSGGELVPYEYTLVTKEGKKIDAILTTKLIKYEGESAILGTVTDITERKKMEKKLRQYSENLEELVQKRTEELVESEKRYSVLVEEASDGVAIVQDGKVVFANKKAAEIIGYSIDELIGLPFEKVVDEKYLQLAIEGYMRRMRGEKLPETAELELIAKTGERVPIEAGSTLINYQGRPSNLVIIRDIRARKRMEEERLRLEKLAAIGEVATMVGHDLRNPLQSIEIATYYLKNELPHLDSSTSTPQKVAEMLKVLSDSVNYADKIVRDLRDFSATKKLKLEKTNINTIVKETLSQVKAPENVKVITKLGNLPKMEADKDILERVFLNLALNGIQAMEKGGTLKVSTKKTKGFEVSFKDTGVGISKENMKKLFTPFFTTKAKGMGMGLAICKRLVDSHGGSIKVESKEGKGTTFTVRLPVQQENGGENQ